MYSAIASPTSPDDVSMTDLNAVLNVRGAQEKASLLQLNALESSIELALPVAPPSPRQPLLLLHHKQSTTKSTHTLRSNIDTKNESNKKRTSLKLDNGVDLVAENGAIVTTAMTTMTKQSSHQQQQQHQRLATVKRCSRNLDNARYRHIEANGINNNNGEFSDSNTNTSSGDGDSSSRSNSGSDGDTEENRNGNNVNNNAKHDIDGNHRKIRRLKQKSNARSAAGVGEQTNKFNNVIANGNDNDDGDYADSNEIFMHNGNSSDSTQKRDSVTSKESSDDYFLCEKFKNTLNAQLCDAVVGGSDDVMQMELMSPHEGPFGRRYAEIAPMKNNNINSKW